MYQFNKNLVVFFLALFTAALIQIMNPLNNLLSTSSAAVPNAVPVNPQPSTLGQTSGIGQPSETSGLSQPTLMPVPTIQPLNPLPVEPFPSLTPFP